MDKTPGIIRSEIENNKEGFMSLFNFFRSIEKHDTNPANTGAIGLPEPVKSVLICG